MFTRAVTSSMFHYMSAEKEKQKRWRTFKSELFASSGAWAGGVCVAPINIYANDKDWANKNQKAITWVESGNCYSENSAQLEKFITRFFCCSLHGKQFFFCNERFAHVTMKNFFPNLSWLFEAWKKCSRVKVFPLNTKSASSYSFVIATKA